MEQLAVWADVEYEIWTDPAKTIPKPPYAAYLARRAERLRAKGLTSNEPTCPDL
jgi:dual specificity phosphatase 12